MAIDRCRTVKIVCDNEQGFSVCNADSVPEGAKIYGVEEKKKPGRKPKVD